MTGPEPWRPADPRGAALAALVILPFLVTWPVRWRLRLAIARLAWRARK